mmetsp:Transcript_26652/g.63926  ORF Transcript_26652/g.63926 Transcript_26652/m.63926 type:complete len:450 (-) Transcript_26652:637-1986(-)
MKSQQEKKQILDSDGSALPKPTYLEVQACQFSSWYSEFRGIDVSTIRNNTTSKKARKNVTIESVVIRPLPSNFIEYLLSDGVRLPECAAKVSSCMNDADDGVDDGWGSSSDDEEDDIDDGSNEKLEKYSFPNLTDRIDSALTKLGGGGCMPKLNWSSPKDATWINCGSLKCTKVGDVYLLLKSSDFVGFDLEKAWDGLEDDNLSNNAMDEMGNLSINLQSKATPTPGDTTKNERGDVSPSKELNRNMSLTKNASQKNAPHDFEYELVLRKWCNLHPSMEFRCFVYEHELVAVSQRHHSKFYPHLQPPSDGTIHPSTAIIQEFFETYIQHRFSQGKIHRYVIDLYVDMQERVWIIDFNVWALRTDGLLFDWKELVSLSTQKKADGKSDIPMLEMRVVTKDMKSMTYDPLSSYRGPTDVMDLMGSGDAGSISDNVPSFEEFMKLCVRPSEI